MKSKLFSPFKIFTDFDGTITQIDSLNMVLDEFAISDWRSIEDKVTSHELSEKEALQAEFDLVNVPLDDAIQFLEKNAKIDPTYKSFAEWCKNKGIELVVLSGGFKEFIDIIFNQYGINDQQIYSNSLKIENNTWQVIQSDLPKIKDLCNHCKTNHILDSKEKGFKVVYIGDGNTDRCPAENADIVFAKNSLAEYLEMKKKKYYKYSNFSEIQKILIDEFII